MKHHKIRQKIPIYVRVKQALQQNDSDVTADREQYAVNTILNNLLTERGKKGTCVFTATNGHQSSSTQDSLGVSGQLALGVTAPALRDGVSTTLMELHLCT